jgi:hypothetical protein
LVVIRWGWRRAFCPKSFARTLGLTESFDLERERIYGLLQILDVGIAGVRINRACINGQLGAAAAIDGAPRQVSESTKEEQDEVNVCMGALTHPHCEQSAKQIDDSEYSGANSPYPGAQVHEPSSATQRLRVW